MLKIFFLFFIVTTHSYTIEFISVENLLKKDSSVTYTKWHSSIHMNFKKFPIPSSETSTWNNPVIGESFVLTIPHCHVFSDTGIIIIKGNTVIEELIWPWSNIKRNRKLSTKTPKTSVTIAGRVAIIAQEGSYNYYHWITEILPKIIMLEELNIEYDWLYLPTLNTFMRETLTVLKRDFSKIIVANKDTYIEADIVIAPSFVSRSCYSTPWVTDVLRKKILPHVNKTEKNKIFISRQKAAYRKLVNEDELFSILEKKGFKKYHLEEMSFLEQVELFHNAKIIVAAHGAGLTNILFSEPGTKVYEIFQEHEDDTFWYLSQLVNLDHTCIKTTEFKKNGGYNNTVIPEDILQFFTNLKI
jgi:hypothetical protein